MRSFRKEVKNNTFKEESLHMSQQTARTLSLMLPE